MTNIPKSLTDSSLTQFNLAISASDPWPFSFYCGDKSSPTNFNRHMPQIRFHHHGSGGREATGIPKGSVAITVGQGAEQQRFVIPVCYVNHPLFSQLLSEAEREYGFDQKGPINIPCHVEEFCQVRCMIDKEKETTSSHHHEHHHDHHHQFLCFKA